MVGLIGNATGCSIFTREIEGEQKRKNSRRDGLHNMRRRPRGLHHDRARTAAALRGHLDDFGIPVWPAPWRPTRAMTSCLIHRAAAAEITYSV